MVRDEAVTAAAARVAAADWETAGGALDEAGFAVLPGLLDEATCRAVAALYDGTAPFRSRVVMERHNFGRGEYKYFGYPLPPLVAALRAALYEPLAAVARGWAARLGTGAVWPETLDAYLEQCHARGQARPTPLLLRYGAGDYNCLHQDLYGDEVFPLQATLLLDAPDDDFDGGEFVLVEQRPRAQSRASVVPLRRGDAVVFAVAERPARGARGWHRTRLRHGVSRVRSGTRRTLGIIFHDAR